MTKRHDTRLLYLCGDIRCPCPVSVRLPTHSCQGGCWYCCRDSWRGPTRYGLHQTLSTENFCRLWDKIFRKHDFTYVWPQEKILLAIKKKRVLRFVREDLFEPSIRDITDTVLETCYTEKFGLLVKTSSLFVASWTHYLRKIRHCIIFTVNNLLRDWEERLTMANWLIQAGINVTLSLKPIKKFSPTIKEILEGIDPRVNGVEVGWLYGRADWFVDGELKKKYRVVNRESQYRDEILDESVGEIIKICDARHLDRGFYFSSQYSPLNSARSCCLADKVL